MNQDTTMIHDDQLAIVLGQRQLVAVCCMFLVVIGLVSTLAYVAGRSITAATLARTSDLLAPAPGPLVVDPTRRKSTVGTTTVIEPTAPPATAQPAAAEAIAEPPAKPSPFGDATPATVNAAVVAEPSPAPPVAMAASAPAAAEAPQAAPMPPAAAPATVSEPAAGQTYFQVGSIEPSMAAVFSNYLAEQGFRVRLARGANATVVRVLVGPLANDREIQSVGAALDKAGFEHFLKKY